MEGLKIQNKKTQTSLEPGVTLGVLKCLAYCNEKNQSETWIRMKNHP